MSQWRYVSDSPIGSSDTMRFVGVMGIFFTHAKTPGVLVIDPFPPLFSQVLFFKLHFM
jgi:hypothetical protein